MHIRRLAGTPKNLLRDPIAAQRGARPLACLLATRLALGPLATVFRAALAYGFLGGLTILAPLPAGAVDVPWRITRQVDGSFDQVLQALVLAIENKGLVISYQSHVSEMLERTGKDLGSPAPLYKGARVLEFCSAAWPRAAMAADPHAVLACPYKIAVYETVQAPDKVWVSYPRLSKTVSPAARPVMRRVEQLLEEIVREALP